jgi:hypothetical protein
MSMPFPVIGSEQAKRPKSRFSGQIGVNHSGRELNRYKHPQGIETHLNYNKIWSMLRQTFSAWNEHEAPRLGAALAFYTILSLAPLVILVMHEPGRYLRSAANWRIPCWIRPTDPIISQCSREILIPYAAYSRPYYRPKRNFPVRLAKSVLLFLGVLVKSS